MPWLFTPAKANGDRLQPWLVLVVVPDDESTRLLTDPIAPLPVLKISENAGEKLPPLDESWAWVHVQCTKQVTDASLAQDLADQPEAFLARLMCPILLQPHTAYLACLVPAFKAGADVGLGLPAPDGPLANAWSRTTGALDLPVYYSWRFTTGEDGDFEALAKRLRGVILDETVGVRSLNLDAAGPDLPATEPDTFAGALMSPQAQQPPWFRANRTDFVDELGKAINRRKVDRETPPANYHALRDDPVVSPPLYGSWQQDLDELPIPGTFAKTGTVQPDLPDVSFPIEPNLSLLGQDTLSDLGGILQPLTIGQPFWAVELNLRPANRGGAGLGADIIRRDQEALMSEAWLTARHVRAVNRELAYTRQAAAVNGRLSKRLQSISDDGTFLQLTRLLHRRMRPETADKTAFSTLSASPNIPNGVISHTMRRQSRTVGTIDQRLAKIQTNSAPVMALTGLYFVPIPDAKMLPSNTPPEPGGLSKPNHDMLNKLAPIYGSTAAAVATTPQPILTADDELTGLAQTIKDHLDPQPHLQKQLFSRIPALEAFSVEAKQLSPIVKRVSVSPRFTDPAYKRLRDLSPEYLLPGFSGIPEDSVSLLVPNPTFIEAFMVGLNHEMSREFLWREYPAVLHETWFEHFWERPSGTRDMTAIRSWEDDTHLGFHAPVEAETIELVLLIKGELVRRYPNVLVLAERANGPKAPSGEIKSPIFRGDIGEGTLFAAFDIKKESASGADGGDGWFFVLQEQATESRFGLDIGNANHFGDIPNRANDISWQHAAGTQEDFQVMTFARTTAGEIGGALAGATISGESWGSDAAGMARLTYQRPVRMLIHGDQLLED